MAKKKKALKPVARVFATVSVPKKPTPLEEPLEEPQNTAANAGHTSGMQSSETLEPPPQMDQAALEEGVLQAIVEKFQDKTEKDVVRNVKVRYLIDKMNGTKFPETLIPLGR